ncbi:hypothetical protein ACSBR2_007990 [Camellia fascicularis]
MGRVKLKIKRLESTSNQQVTYLRRRNGILKKAKELFILCDIDIVLLMFSPTGKATLFRRERRCYDQAFGSNCICYQIGYGELKLKDGRVAYTPHEDGGQGEDEEHEEELGRDEDDDDEGDEEESGTEDVEDGDEFCKEP